MLWGDLKLKSTPDGTAYLEYTERATETRKGISHDHKHFMPKIFEQKGDPNCPVQLYLLYKEKRPLNMADPKSRFYAAINPRFDKLPDQVWFINQSMGKNTFGNLVKKMAEKAELQGRHVNHSGRKTCISTLLDAECHPTEVAQISGHKNLMSLNHYHSLNMAKQQAISTIIHEQHKTTSTINQPASVNSFTNDSDEMSDQELFQTSQEIENTLTTIEKFEQVQEVVDLPVVQSPGGSFHISKFLEKPQALFQGCTFNSDVNIVLKSEQILHINKVIMWTVSPEVICFLSMLDVSS